MASIEDFKPCPFCGEKNFHITERAAFDYVSRDSDKVVVYIYCRNCLLSMNDRISANKDYDGRISSLRDKWNRRVCCCAENK